MNAPPPARLDDSRTQPLGPPTIWFDVSDLLTYAEHGNTTVSGIQRVVANLVHQAGRARHRVVMIAVERNSGRLVGVDTTSVFDLATALQDGSAASGEIQDSWHRIWAARIVVSPQPGDVLLIPGAFWICNNRDEISRLCRCGLKVMIYLYDLIYVSHPEYIPTNHKQDFIRSFVDLMDLSSSVLTISNYVRDELRRYLGGRFGLDLPVESMVLPTELPPNRGSQVVDSALTRIAAHEFVLVVATIEVRKNHVYLLRVWDRLRQEGVPLPNLVFVGKWGWDVEELKRTIVELGALDRWLFVINGLSDAGLSYLYERCLMTAYVSFAEGFGLPVAESLAHGKPCVASDRTSVPEVGGDFVRLVNPSDLDMGVGVFREVLGDRKALDSWAERIRADYRPRTWDSFCESFYVAVDAHLESGPRPNPEGNFRFGPGRLFGFGDEYLRRLEAGEDPLVSARMARAGGWHVVDAGGVWASDRVADLRLPTRVEPGADVTVFILARAQRMISSSTITVEAGAAAVRVGPTEPQDILWSVAGRIGHDGVLAVRIRAEGGKPEEVDGATVWFGLRAIGFGRPDDLAARLSILGSASFWPDREVLESLSFLSHKREMLKRIGVSATPAPLRSVFLALARRAGRRRQWRGVVRNYGRLYRRGGLEARQWVQLGHAFRELGEHEAAAGAYQSALDVSPGHADATDYLRRELRVLE